MQPSLSHRFSHCACCPAVSLYHMSCTISLSSTFAAYRTTYFLCHTYIYIVSHVTAALSAVIAPSVWSRASLAEVCEDVIHQSLSLFVSPSVCCRAGCPISQPQGGGSLDHPDHAQRSPCSSPWDPFSVWRHVRRRSHPEPAGPPGTHLASWLTLLDAAGSTDLLVTLHWVLHSLAAAVQYMQPDCSKCFMPKLLWHIINHAPGAWNACSIWTTCCSTAL